MCISLTAIPDSILLIILHLACSGAPALALTCRTLSSMWRDDPAHQALWLLDNSSSILVKHSTKRKLQKLFNVARSTPGVAPMDMLRLTWSLRAEPGRGKYGDCEGKHPCGNRSSFGCCRLPKATCDSALGQPTLESKGTSANLAERSVHQHRGGPGARSQNSAAPDAAVSDSVGHRNGMFCVQGKHAHAEILSENGGVFLAACWRGKASAVGKLLHHG